MKRYFLYLMILSFAAFAFVRCKKDEKNYVRTLVSINLTSWNLPTQANVSTPFSLALHTKTTSTCYSDIHFYVEEADGEKYIYAQALYDNSGGDCSSLTVTKDSTLSYTFSHVGKIYFNFLYENAWKRDSINIISPL